MKRYLTDRREIAEVMNFGKYPVLRVNLETPKAGWDDAYEGDFVRVVPDKPKYEGDVLDGKINLFADGNGRYSIMPRTVCLSNDFGYSDVIENMTYAKATQIHPGETVVVIEDFPISRTCRVHMMRVSDRVTRHTYPICHLEELAE